MTGTAIEKKMVEVFKTNVHRTSDADQLVALLKRHLPGSRINFALDDCDKILRVEGHYFDPEKIIVWLEEKGFECAVLE